jgi:hypothetical protein
MFDDDDDDDDDLEETIDDKFDFYDWFDYHRDLFPPELIDEDEPDQLIYYFHDGVYTDTLQSMEPKIREFVFRHYPEMKSGIHPMMAQRIGVFIALVGRGFFVSLFTLLYDERKGSNFRQKYPEFESWIEKHARPYDHFEVLNEVFAETPWLTEELKQQMIDEHAKDINWKEVRRSEFKTILVDLAFQFFPKVEDLSADGWIVFAYLLDSEYADFRYRFEFVSDFIRCGLTEEDWQLSYSEISKKIKEHYDNQLRS